MISWFYRAILQAADITKTQIFKYIENFTTKKGKFSDETFWIFLHILVQNMILCTR